MSDLESWLYKWEIKIITDKSTAEIFTKGRQVPRKRLKRFEQGIPWSTEAKYLTIHHYRSLTWKAHIKAIASKTMQRFVAIYSIFKCRTLDKKLKTRLYKSLIPSILLYGAPPWGYAAISNMKQLQVVQNKITWTIYDGERYTSNTSIYIALDVRTLKEEIERPSAKLCQRIRKHDKPIIAAP
jgi:hypothetical protein